MVQDQGVILKPLENKLVKLDSMRGVALGNGMEQMVLVQWTLNHGPWTPDGSRLCAGPSVA